MGRRANKFCTGWREVWGEEKIAAEPRKGTAFVYYPGRARPGAGWLAGPGGPP